MEYDIILLVYAVLITVIALFRVFTCKCKYLEERISSYQRHYNILLRKYEVLQEKTGKTVEEYPRYRVVAGKKKK